MSMEWREIQGFLESTPTHAVAGRPARTRVNAANRGGRYFLETGAAAAAAARGAGPLNWNSVNEHLVFNVMLRDHLVGRGL